MSGSIDRSAQARPGRSVPGLPTPLSTFIGRKAEVIELRALLAAARLVTLTGPGGSGKTRLALEVAANMRGVDEPAIFVDLSPIKDPSIVLPTIAASLGKHAESAERSVDPLVDEIGGRQLLLLLDNLEQLPGAGPIVVDLLAASPTMRVLATSRAPLHVRGEQEYPVHPLALPSFDLTASPDVLAQFDAVALFVDRARAIDPHFTLNARNAAAIADICRGVDGLPLAIELAAGQLKMLTPDALQRRLERRLPLLTAGTADAPARQRTLRDTIAWSYDLLDPADRIVFARASVFVGGFGTPDAEAVLPDPAEPPLDVTASLGRLADLNLLRVAPDAEGEPRLSFLETIREFAADQLVETDTEPLRARHARHFGGLAEASMRNISGPQRAAWLRRASYGPDLGNVRAAVEWSRTRNDLELLVQLVAASPPFFENLTPGWEGLGTAEAIAESADPAVRAYLLQRLGLYAMMYGGDRVHSRELFHEARRLYEARNDRIGMAEALRNLAAAAFDLEDRRTAGDEIEWSLDLARGVSDQHAVARLLTQIASVYIPLHPPAEGIPLAQEVIERGVAVDYPSTVGYGHDFLGGALLAAGDLDGAIAALSESVRLWRKMGEESNLGNNAVALLGMARLRAGELAESRLLLRSSAASARASGVVWRGLTVLEAVAEWLGAAGRSEAATVCWAGVDATRAITRDRTWQNDFGLFAASRERDRSAIAAAVYRDARATGEAMSLPEALDYGLRALDETVVDDSRGARAERSNRHDLTAREREVLALVAAGQTDGQIAEALFISKKTAAVHVANIKSKLGASSRVEIVTLALRRGLVPDSR